VETFASALAKKRVSARVNEFETLLQRI